MGGGAEIAEVIAKILMYIIVVYLVMVFMSFLMGGAGTEEKEVVKFAIVADIHLDTTARADLERQNALAYIEEFCDNVNNEGVDFIVVLGDSVDAWDGSTRADENTIRDRISRLRSTIETKCKAKVYYVLGNHEIANVYKSTIIQLLGMPGKYYSWEVKGFKFIALDPFNYEREVDVPQDCGLPYNCIWAEFKIYDEEKNWLIQQLNEGKPTIIFVHVPLSGFFEGYGTNGEYYNTIKNAQEIRDILEQYDNVIAVFEAHYHNPDGDEISGGNHYMWRSGRVPYFGIYSLVDVDNIKSYAIVTIDPNTRTIRVECKGAKPKIFEERF